MGRSTQGRLSGGECGPAGRGGSAWKRRELEAVGGVARPEPGKGSRFLHDGEKVEASRGGFYVEVG